MNRRPLRAGFLLTGLLLIAGVVSVQTLMRGDALTGQQAVTFKECAADPAEPVCYNFTKTLSCLSDWPADDDGRGGFADVTLGGSGGCAPGYVIYYQVPTVSCGTPSCPGRCVQCIPASSVPPQSSVSSAGQSSVPRSSAGPIFISSRSSRSGSSTSAVQICGFDYPYCSERIILQSSSVIGCVTVNPCPAGAVLECGSAPVRCMAQPDPDDPRFGTIPPSSLPMGCTGDCCRCVQPGTQTSSIVPRSSSSSRLNSSSIASSAPAVAVVVSSAASSSVRSSAQQSSRQPVVTDVRSSHSSIGLSAMSSAPPPVIVQTSSVPFVVVPGKPTTFYPPSQPVLVLGDNTTVELAASSAAAFSVAPPPASSVPALPPPDVCGDGVIAPDEKCNEPGLTCPAGWTCHTTTCRCEPPPPSRIVSPTPTVIDIDAPSAAPLASVTPLVTVPLSSSAPPEEPLTESGPEVVLLMTAGAATGYAWVRMRRKKIA